MTRSIGFLVNPIAGMGGAVGLKGTDGELVPEAIRRGARPRAGARAVVTLRLLVGAPFHFLTCSGEMGEDVLRAAGIPGTHVEIVYASPASTTREDTRNACREFTARGVDLILFCGGDGTARDVYDVVLDRLPVLGIPAGVKMYSAVFAVTPEAVADILREGPTILSHLRDAEIVDVDEEAYRKGELRTRLHGYAKSPYRPGLIQETKQVFEDRDEERAKEGIARFMADVIRGTPDTLYILGPGTTTGAIAGEFGIAKTLLGFDLLKGGTLVAADVNEQMILSLLPGESKVRLVISIIGAQGSVLGRGTQQVSPAVLRRIGTRNVIIVSTPHKLAETPLLFMDTGDPELDREFGEYATVVSGYHMAQRKRIGRDQDPCG